MFKNGSLHLVLLLFLLGLAPRFAWGVQSPRLLLDQATKVAAVKNAAVICWLSDHTLLLITSDKRTAKHKWNYEPSQWKGRAHLLETRTHRRTSLSGLTRMLQRWHWEPWECEPVLGGKWLLWWAADAPDHYPNTLVSTENGSRHFRWQFTKGPYYWLNTHIWINQDRLGGMYENYPLLHIFDVNHPAREKSLRVDALATRRWITRQASEAFVYEILDDESNPASLPLRIGKYRVADYHLQEHPRPLRTYPVALPAHLEVENVKISPDNKKALIETASKQWRTLWTCRVDGSHLHSLGSIHLKEDYYTVGARWLPGSKQIGFPSGDNLYTVSAD